MLSWEQQKGCDTHTRSPDCTCCFKCASTNRYTNMGWRNQSTSHISRYNKYGTKYRYCWVQETTLAITLLVKTLKGKKKHVYTCICTIVFLCILITFLHKSLILKHKASYQTLCKWLYLTDFTFKWLNSLFLWLRNLRFGVAVTIVAVEAQETQTLTLNLLSKNFLTYRNNWCWW